MTNISKLHCDYQETYLHTRNLIQTNLKSLNDAGSTYTILPRTGPNDFNIVIQCIHPVWLTDYIVFNLNRIYMCSDEPGRPSNQPYCGCQVSCSLFMVEFELTIENVMAIIDIMNKYTLVRLPFMHQVDTVIY